METNHTFPYTIYKKIDSFSQLKPRALIPTDKGMNLARFVLLLISFQDVVIDGGNYLIETEDGNYLVEANNIERDYNEAVYEASR